MESATRNVVGRAALSDAAGQALAEIDQVSTETASLIERISADVQEQAATAGRVAAAMKDILAVTEQTSLGTRQTAVSIDQLAELAVELKGSVSGFKGLTTLAVARKNSMTRHRAGPGTADLGEGRDRRHAGARARNPRARLRRQRTAGLQFAQSHLHQVRGALDIVGLDGLTLFSTPSNSCSAMAPRRGCRPTPRATRSPLRALAMVGNYLEELADGAARPAAGSPRFCLELADARQHDASAADLFHPDFRAARLRVRPCRRARPGRGRGAARDTQPLRARSAGVAAQGRWRAKARVMRDAIAEVGRSSSLTGARSLWWANLAFYDALITAGCSPTRR